jgi:hypothetical protein
MLTHGALDLSLAYAQLKTFRDIDAVACAIRDNDGCIIGIYGKNNGSWRTENPQPPNDTSDRWAHWVCGVEAKLINGKKTITFINSWGQYTGFEGRQYINEDYFTSGNIWCVWTVTEKENVIVPEFQYTWTKTMKFGDSNTDVKALQKMLKILGLFPESQSITGYFGKITKDAVIKFQINNGLKGDGIAGKLTIAKLNML